MRNPSKRIASHIKPASKRQPVGYPGPSQPGAPAPMGQPGMFSKGGAVKKNPNKPAMVSPSKC